MTSQELRCGPDSSAGRDVRLVARLVENHHDAWVEFDRRFTPLLRSVIATTMRRFRMRASEEDFRDIHATLMLSLFAHDRRKLRSFDPAQGKSFRTWMCMLAAHCAHDHLRTARRTPESVALDETEELASPRADPFEDALREQRGRLAVKALAAFSAKDRAFVDLYFGQSMEPADVARALNISVATVYAKRHKLEARLTELLTAGTSDLAA